MDATSASTVGSSFGVRATTTLRRPVALLPAALAVAALVVFVGSPVWGWFPVVRLTALLWPVLVAALTAVAPWQWRESDWDGAARWEPSRRQLAAGVAASAVALLWIVYSRFVAGEINAVDFTIYFDRPLFQTSRGNWYFVESANEARFANLSHLAVHAYWILLPLSLLYWIHATPLWLLALSVVAVVAGGVHTYRIVREIGGSAALAAAAGLAFLLNDNTARTLNYGFHAEVLYAWFVPWAIDAGLRRARASFLLAAIASVLVKEDAIFPLFALSMTLALMRRQEMDAADRMIFLGVPTALALLNLWLFWTLVVPWLSPGGEVMYESFWGSHGATPWQAGISLIKHPGTLFAGVLTSGVFSIVLIRHLFLPLLGWRWLVGVVPLLAVYGASDNDQIRMFGIYYAIPLVPFLTVAGASGARALAARMCGASRSELVAALLVVVSALVLRPGYMLRPWRPELAQVKTLVNQLASEDRILVQSGLYPHAGYASNAQLLAPPSLSDPASAGAMLLLAPDVSAFPFDRSELQCLASGPGREQLSEGLLAVRLTERALSCRNR